MMRVCVCARTCVCQVSIFTSVLQLADGHSHAGVREGEREAPGDPPFPAGAGGPGFWDHSPGYRDKGHVKVWPEGPESLIPAAVGNQTSPRATQRDTRWTLTLGKKTMYFGQKSRLATDHSHSKLRRAVNLNGTNEWSVVVLTLF